MSSSYTHSFLPLCELCVGVTMCHSMGRGKGAGHGSGSNLMILGKGGRCLECLWGMHGYMW